MGKLYNINGDVVSWNLVPEIAACDIETSGLEYAYDDINIIQIGTSGDQYWTDEIDDHMFSELKKRKLIFHNGKFDTKFLANKFGYLLDIYGDTMVMLHATGWEYGYGLKEACERILGVKHWDVDVEVKTGMSKD